MSPYEAEDCIITGGQVCCDRQGALFDAHYVNLDQKTSVGYYASPPSHSGIRSYCIKISKSEVEEGGIKITNAVKCTFPIVHYLVGCKVFNFLTNYNQVIDDWLDEILFRQHIPWIMGSCGIKRGKILVPNTVLVVFYDALSEHDSRRHENEGCCLTVNACISLAQLFFHQEYALLNFVHMPANCCFVAVMSALSKTSLIRNGPLTLRK